MFAHLNMHIIVVEKLHCVVAVSHDSRGSELDFKHIELVARDVWSF